MKYTNTDSVQEKLDDAEYEQWNTPLLWESEAAKVLFQVYPVTNQIIKKIEQEIDK
jgi:hypothetical protein